MNRQPIYPRGPRLRGGNSSLPSFFGFYFTAFFGTSPSFTVNKVLRQAFIDGFWVVVADDSVGVHRLVVLFDERDVRDWEYYLCRHGILRTQGLSPPIWIVTPSLHSAKMLGVCS